MTPGVRDASRRAKLCCECPLPRCSQDSFNIGKLPGFSNSAGSVYSRLSDTAASVGEARLRQMRMFSRAGGLEKVPDGLAALNVACRLIVLLISSCMRSTAPS
jgi:hypothetical protein